MYKASGPGHDVELLAYYSKPRQDFWVVGSAASKAQALSLGCVAWRVLPRIICIAGIIRHCGRCHITTLESH